jgi:hypothetical protein
LHAVLSKKRSVNPWKMAINRYSGGMHLPNEYPALAGKQLAYNRVPTMMHEKMNTRTLNARAAFQLASISTVSGYAWQYFTIKFPPVVEIAAKDS